LDRYCAEGGRLEDLAQRFHDAGLRVMNLIGFFDWAVDDPVQRDKGLDEARRNFAQAQALSCPYVAAPPWHLTDERVVDLLPIAERYAQLVDIASEFDVVPLLAYWGHSKTLCRLSEALLILSECNRPEARILADVFHTYKGTGHFEGVKLLTGHSLGLLHINDYPAEPSRDVITDDARVYPGDGVAPLTEILATLARNGYTGMVSLELFNETYWAQPPDTVARTGIEKLRAVIAKAVG
jgi:sugar phosphate isomerase/epimerase